VGTNRLDDRIRLVVLVMLVGVLLTGCSSKGPSDGGGPEATATPTATVEPSKATTTSAAATEAAVPDVFGMDAEGAAAAIRAAGFVPELYAQVGWADSPEDKAFRTVVESYPRPDTTWPQGATVSLGLALPDGWTVVPSIEGLPNAEAILKAYGLRAKEISVHGPIEEDQAGFMLPYRQSPRPGTAVRKGSTVKYRAWWEKS